MLAALNHPNIATIHGLEQSEGVHYLVMELVPGETLAQRVKTGALNIKEALAIAGQVAEALEAAHETGVIHRDLKPANVNVTPDGRAKVLDFGLAKAFAGDGGVDLSQAPTLTGMAGKEGGIVGTPAYMSPEQARGGLRPAVPGTWPENPDLLGWRDRPSLAAPGRRALLPQRGQDDGRGGAHPIDVQRRSSAGSVGRPLFPRDELELRRPWGNVIQL